MFYPTKTSNNPGAGFYVIILSRATYLDTGYLSNATPNPLNQTRLYQEIRCGSEDKN